MRHTESNQDHPEALAQQPHDGQEQLEAREDHQSNRRAIQRVIIAAVLMALAYLFREQTFALLHWVLAALGAGIGILAWDKPSFVGWRAALFFGALGSAVLLIAAYAWGWPLLFSFNDLLQHDPSRGHIMAVMFGAFFLFMGVFAGLAGFAKPR